MNDEDLQGLQASITRMESEVAALSQTASELNARARQLNDSVRKAHGQRAEIGEALTQAKATLDRELARRAIEAKRKANEEAAARAAEAKRAAEEAAEAKASEPPMPSPMQILSEQVAILTAKIEELTAK